MHHDQPARPTFHRPLCCVIALLAAAGIGCGDADGPSDSFAAGGAGSGSGGATSGGGGSAQGGSGGAPSTGVDRAGVFLTANSYVTLQLDAAVGSDERSFHFGIGAPAWSGLTPVAGDFDGDGADSLGFYNGRLGTFYLANGNVEGVIDRTVAFAPTSGNVFAIVGDFDGDGVDTVGLYDRESFTFHLSNDPSGSNPVSVPFGEAGALPVVGDFDGDGVDTIGVYVIAEGRFSLRNDNSPGAADLEVVLSPGQFPLAADIDGDGMDTVGVFDPSTNVIAMAHHNETGAELETINLDKPLYQEFGPGAEPNPVPTVFPVMGRWSTAGEATPNNGFAWPVAAPEDHGMLSGALTQVSLDAASLSHVHSLLVVRDGALVHESYYRGFDPSVGNNVKSVSKSLLSALWGIAYDQGAFGAPGGEIGTALGQPLTGYLSEYIGAATPKAQITLADLITMRAGLAWTENGLGPGMVASPDWIDWVLSQPLVSGPGNAFNYSTGLTHVGSELLTRVTGQSSRDFALQALYQPLGIAPARWDFEPNEGGPFVGGAEVWLRPRDMARFGQLYLDGGCSSPGDSCPAGQQLVRKDWVTWTTSDLTGAKYGGWWWVESFAGHPTFHALGHGGQHIFVIRDLQMVVVITSSWGVPYNVSGNHIGQNKGLLTQILNTALAG